MVYNNDNLSMSPCKNSTSLYTLHTIKYVYTKYSTTIRRNKIDLKKQNFKLKRSLMLTILISFRIIKDFA